LLTVGGSSGLAPPMSCRGIRKTPLELSVQMDSWTGVNRLAITALGDGLPAPRPSWPWRPPRALS
jgi:hypothetical protein